MQSRTNYLHMKETIDKSVTALDAGEKKQILEDIS